MPRVWRIVARTALACAHRALADYVARQPRRITRVMTDDCVSVKVMMMMIMVIINVRGRAAQSER